PEAGRTDEEIQIVFDRYKAALYRIYNRELRKNPTLRGKILLRISIETSGAVSLCMVESTDLESPELVDRIVARIKRFNFGPKEGVPKMTILYPIDFLPAA
ncbi:MAG: AgmX/PglI C-terminal domain-containing protein, partial [Thiogranum sp.]